MRTQEFWLLACFCHTMFSSNAWSTKTNEDKYAASPISLNENPFGAQRRSVHFPIQTTCRKSTSTAAVPNNNDRRSRVFCVCAWVPCPVCAAVDGQLRASCKMLLTETLFSLCNHDNRGSAHPKFLYRSRNHVGISTNWTQGIIRLLRFQSHDSTDEQGFIMVTRRRLRNTLI